MKNIRKITSVAVAGIALTAFSSTAFAAAAETAACGGCCSMATPMADKAKADKAYPLDTCIVSDEKLDQDPDMKSYTFVYEGQEIKLCCKSCKKKFDKDPAKYMKKLADATAKK